MPEFADLPLEWNAGLFSLAALIIAVAGWKLASLADRLADLTGMGEAISGAVLLGASTSLPGIITSAITASEGYAELAVSNAVGGIAAQTAFLSIADIFHRRTNLEHAAASVSNILQGTLLITLLALPLLAATAPEFVLWTLHPVSLVIPAVYLYGMHQVAQARNEPTWRPQQTPETREDIPEEDTGSTCASAIWFAFGVTAIIVGAAGWLVARTGMAIADQSALSQTAVGGFFTAVATSLPELATTIAAVRQGALTLAVGNIIGGNSFDTLFLAIADGAYRDGSIYHHVTERQTFLLALTILLTAILVMGLVRREKKGIGNIGFESFSILLLYVIAVLFMFMAGD